MRKKWQIEKLKKDEREAWELKETWKKKYTSARDLLDSAEAEMKRTLHEHNIAEDELRQADKVLRSSDEAYTGICQEYGERILCVNSHLELLKLKAEMERASMEEAFGISDFAYRNRDKGTANDYSKRGYDHKKKYEEALGQIRETERQIQGLKDEMKKLAPREALADYAKAEEKYLKTELRYKVAQENYNQRKKEQEICKKGFDYTCKTHARIRKNMKKAISN